MGELLDADYSLNTLIFISNSHLSHYFLDSSSNSHLNFNSTSISHLIPISFIFPKLNYDLMFPNLPTTSNLPIPPTARRNSDSLKSIPFF